MRKAQGFILILLLCIIALVSILLVTSMHHILLYRNALGQQEIKHLQFYQLERLARTLALKPEKNPACIRVQNDPNSILEILTQKKGCQWILEKSQYQYLIEDLGIFPCLIQNSQSQWGTHHWRLSVLSNNSVLQLYIIQKNSIENTKCNKELHFVPTGITSWRYLTDLPD